MVRWGAFLVLGMLAVRIIPVAMRWHRHRQAELESQAVLVSRMRATLADMESLTDSVTRARAGLLGLDSLLLEAHSGIGAFAEVSLRMRTLADRYSLTLLGMTQQPDTAVAPPFRRARVHVSLEGDSRGLIRALQALGEETPMLVVTSLVMQARDPASEPEVLTTEIGVTGWFLDRGTER